MADIQNSTYKVFISHSGKDKNFVRRLAADLKTNGVDSWVDEAEIRPGDNLVERIEDGMASATHVIVVLSEESLVSSWVKEELNAAHLRAVEENIRLIPIIIGNLDVKKIPLLLRIRLYVDFRDSSHYKDSISTLLGAFDKTTLTHTETFKKNLTRIESAYFLSKADSADCALELLIHNPEKTLRMISRLTVGYTHTPCYAGAYEPSIYSYRITLNVGASIENDRFSISGESHTEGDEWTRPVTGMMAVAHVQNAYIDFSCPFFIKVPAEDSCLVRLEFSAPNIIVDTFRDQTRAYHPAGHLAYMRRKPTDSNSINDMRFFEGSGSEAINPPPWVRNLPESGFRYRETRSYGASYVILKLDHGGSTGAWIYDDRLVQIFYKQLEDIWHALPEDNPYGELFSKSSDEQIA